MTAAFIIFLAFGVSGGLFWLIGNGYQNQMQSLNTKLTDQQAIGLARQHNGELSVTLLCEYAGVSSREARTKIYHMVGAGILSQAYDYTNFRFVYRLADRYECYRPHETGHLPTSPPAVSHADIIALAVEAGGRLSPASLCLKSRLSIDAASQALQELKDKQVFTAEVDINGVLVYELVDRSLLQEPSPPNASESRPA